MRHFSLLALLPLSLLLVTFASAGAPQSRARRFCCGGGGGMEMAGGKIGCVVSQNKLYINGIFTKDLSEDEQQELGLYKDAQTQFKDQVQNYLEQRFNATSEEEVEQLKKPEPLKKPSFCSEKATTQFVFDGCVVQGDSVYIGSNFVRKLSPDEQQKLQEFDEKFTSYQEALSGQIRSQIEEAFGKTFGNMFSPMVGTKSGGNRSASNEISGQQQDQGRGQKLEVPKSPDFCTLIV